MPQIESTPSTEMDSAMLELPVEGQHLGGAACLGELLGRGPSAKPTLLVFLRHFG